MTKSWLDYITTRGDPLPDHWLEERERVQQEREGQSYRHTRPANGSATRKLRSKSGSEIAMRHICWVWFGRIAVGKHTVIAGEPGIAKSQLLLWICIGRCRCSRKGTGRTRREAMRKGGWKGCSHIPMTAVSTCARTMCAWSNKKVGRGTDPDPRCATTKCPV